MAKKAKLDILEITIDEKSEDKLHDDITLEAKEEESDEKRSGLDILSKIKGWVRKPLFWIMLISVVMLGLIGGIFISLNEGMDEKGPVEQKKRAVSGIPVPAEVKMVLSETAKTVDSDRVDVRNVIYTLLKQETVKEGLSSEGKTRLKERLRNELNNLFGENLIKNIYFTRYEMN